MRGPRRISVGDEAGEGEGGQDLVCEGKGFG